MKYYWFILSGNLITDRKVASDDPEDASFHYFAASGSEAIHTERNNEGELTEIIVHAATQEDAEGIVTGYLDKHSE